MMMMMFSRADRLWCKRLVLSGSKLSTLSTFLHHPILILLKSARHWIHKINLQKKSGANAPDFWLINYQKLVGTIVFW
jgi:hypothetical protein